MNRKLLFLSALTVIVAAAAYRVLSEHFDWDLFISSLSNLNVGWILLSIAVSLSTYLCRAIRWRTLLKPLKRVPLTSLFWTTIVGFAAIYVLGRAAELVRPAWLSKRENIPFSASMATIVVERFLDSLMLVVMFASALMLIPVPDNASEILAKLKKAGFGIAAVAVGGLVALFVVRSGSGWIVRTIRNWNLPRVAKLAENFAQGLRVLASARSLAAVLVQSAILWIVMSMQLWLLLRGMNFDFSVEAATLVMVACAIGSIAQLPGIGGGFQVAFVFCMTTFFLVPTEQAAATSLLAFVFSHAPTVLAGSLYLLIQGISVRDIKGSLRDLKSETV